MQHEGYQAGINLLVYFLMWLHQINPGIRRTGRFERPQTAGLRAQTEVGRLIMRDNEGLQEQHMGAAAFIMQFAGIEVTWIFKRLRGFFWHSNSKQGRAMQ